MWMQRRCVPFEVDGGRGGDSKVERVINSNEDHIRATNKGMDDGFYSCGYVGRDKMEETY